MCLVRTVSQNQTRTSAALLTSKPTVVKGARLSNMRGYFGRILGVLDDKLCVPAHDRVTDSLAEATDVLKERSPPSPPQQKKKNRMGGI